MLYIQYFSLKEATFTHLELEITPERSSAVKFKLRMVFLKSMRQSGAHFRCLVPIHGKGWIGYDGMGFKGYLQKESRCVLSSNKLVCSFDNGCDTGLRYVTSAGSYQIDGMMYEFVNEEKNGGMKLYGNIFAYGYDNSDDDESDKFDEPAEISSQDSPG